MEPKEKTVQLRYFIAECYYCKVPCVVQCGHCNSASTYLGQKHNCPDPDKGFFDDNDFDIQICGQCDQKI